MLELALATPVCLWSAWPFYVRAVQSVRNKSLNMFTLIGLGVSVAYGYSLIAALFPAGFPASFRLESGEVAVYFEAAGIIVTLILLGQVLELRARSQTSAAIKKLLGMAAKTARRIRDDGSEEDVAARRGAGGRSAAGASRARRSRSMAWCSRVRAASTNRWSPASRSRWKRRPGDTVIGATINGTGGLVMRAEKVGAETLLSRIVRDGGRGAAQPRADPEAGRRASPATSCRR